MTTTEGMSMVVDLQTISTLFFFVNFLVIEELENLAIVYLACVF